ncbi:MAG: hypothetical protein QMB11_07055 [Nonlabens sp.]|uniref:hypothetical protein n=1 Tax=Nonlabens sp. TaxID=1888209 RepID=UPI0035A68F67
MSETSDLYSTVAIFLTAGFIIGTIAQRLLHKPEEYAFQNLGISKLQRYSFAYVLHIAMALIASFFIWIIVKYV